MMCLKFLRGPQFVVFWTMGIHSMVWPNTNMNFDDTYRSTLWQLKKYPEPLIKHAGGVVVKHLSISIVDQILEGGGCGYHV